ncbi:MAG: BspA family leucine-rich repeat surface protein [Clostridia bacterium]|nr:BspA family leucine-rich repeat surface protein [Clostridia bacterium]
MSKTLCCTLLLLLLAVLLTAGSAEAPAEQPAQLVAGITLNERMKSVAAGTAKTLDDTDTLIRAIRTADALPPDFAATETNTVSAEDSAFPVYLFFDNTDDAGILYFYTEAGRIAARDLYGAFAFLTSLSDISGLAEWDLSDCTSLLFTFRKTPALQDISPLAGWDTSHVELFAYTFFQCGLTDGSPLAGWDTSSATVMVGFFQLASSLTTIDVSNWDTSHVFNMQSMFSVGENYAGNGQLREIIGLDRWDVSQVKDMTAMFYGAGQMTHYDIAGWDVSSVLSFNHMFSDNRKLESLDLSGWNVQNVRTMYDMFDDAYALTTLGDVSHWNTASLIDIGGWLNGASSFVGDHGTLDLSGWDTSSLKVAGEAFRATKLTTIDLSGWTFDALTNDAWEGAGNGIYYEFGNQSAAYRGLGILFKDTPLLTTVRMDPAALRSFYAALSRGITVKDMWSGSRADFFTVRQPQENTENIPGTVITAMASPVNPKHLAGISCYARILRCNEDRSTLTVELTVPEVFAEEEVLALEIGDAVFTGGEEIEIRSLEWHEEDEYLVINRGSFEHAPGSVYLHQDAWGNYMPDRYGRPTYNTLTVIECPVTDHLLFLDYTSDETGDSLALPLVRSRSELVTAAENGDLNIDNAFVVFDESGQLAAVQRFFVSWQ